MKKLVILCALVLAALLVAPVLGCQQPQLTMPPYEPAKHEPAKGTMSLEITLPSDGAKLNRSPKNIIGHVSDPEATPGEYFLRFVCYFGEGVGGRQGGWITVNVE